MRVCVVGGSGNISTSIVRLLQEVGHDVTCFNRGASGSPPDGVRQIRGDRHQRPAFEATMQEVAFDAAIDMICFDAEDAASSLRAFRGVQHLVVCSTVATYGVELDWLPVTEEHPLRPTTDYGRGKRDADAVFRAAHASEGFPITIIKPALTYGPDWPCVRQLTLHGSPEWVDRARKGKPGGGVRRW
jgi:nucleoside-diphosphate-sugar epimerase